MPDFSEFFIKSKGKPINYKGMVLSLLDEFTIKNGDTLILCIEKTNSPLRQGICVDIVGSCEINGKIFKKGKRVRMHFWEDTAQEPVRIKIFTKKKFVKIENIWEETNSYLMRTQSGKTVTKFSKSVGAGYGGAAMLIEELNDGKRYRCNDGQWDENFDDIVFSVRKVAPS